MRFYLPCVLVLDQEEKVKERQLIFVFDAEIPFDPIIRPFSIDLVTLQQIRKTDASMEAVAQVHSLVRVSPLLLCVEYSQFLELLKFLFRFVPVILVCYFLEASCLLHDRPVEETVISEAVEKVFLEFFVSISDTHDCDLSLVALAVDLEQLSVVANEATQRVAK